MKNRIFSPFALAFLLMLQIAVAQTDGQTQQTQPLLCLWKNGEVVEKQRIPVDSIVVCLILEKVDS